MALLTVSLAAVGLAASTLLVAGSSRVEPAEPVEIEADSIVCRNLDYGYQRVLPADQHCMPRTEVEVTPTS
jgi:hypothetical protein